jgi:ADP-heptose:LPS heptosyltransferase
LALQLMRPGAPFADGRVLILGGPDDRRTTDPLRMALPRDRCLDLVGRIDLLTAHAALKRARLFVGNDSGLMHLAAAAGAPTLGLFGPSDERLYAPWGRHTGVVRGARSLAEIRAIDPDLNQPVCHMLDLAVGDVLGAARALYVQTAALYPDPPTSEPAGAAHG